MGYVKKEGKRWLSGEGRFLIGVAVLLGLILICQAIGLFGGDGKTDFSDSNSNPGFPGGSKQSGSMVSEEEKEKRKSLFGGSVFRLGVVDQEQDSYTELLLRYFKESDAFSSYVRLETGTQEEIEALFEKGQLDGWVLIPDGFIPGMVAIDHVPLTVTLSLADTTKAVLLREVFEAYGRYVAAVESGCMTLYRQMEQAGASEEQLEHANVEISLELILAALGREDFFRYEEQPDSQAVPLPAYYGFSLLGLLPFLLALPGGAALIEEKRNGVLRRIQITNGGLSRWFGSKLLIEGGTAVLLVTAAGTALRKGIGRELEPNRMIASILLCAGIVLAMLLAACLAENRRDYLLAAGMSVLLLAMFGGSFLPLSTVPETMARVAEWLPNRMLAAIWM